MFTGTDRVAVIGDIGGHLEVLIGMLEGLGVEFDPEARRSERSGERAWPTDALTWPDDLHIVQVGDLVHRGPRSAEVVALVDGLIARDVWTQIVGNREQLHVDQSVFHWDETIDDSAIATLRNWWGDGRMTASAVIAVADNDSGDRNGDGDGNGVREWLITHAGLTAGFWQHGLGSPATAVEASKALAEAQADGALWHPGSMLTGVDDDSAGPVWASAASEVYPSWARLDADMPFNQAHGHSTAYDWGRGLWRSDSWIRRKLILSPDLRHVTFTHRGRWIVGTDPGHLHDPAPISAPLVLTGARVVVAGR